MKIKNITGNLIVLDKQYELPTNLPFDNAHSIAVHLASDELIYNIFPKLIPSYNGMRWARVSNDKGRWTKVLAYQVPSTKDLLFICERKIEANAGEEVSVKIHSEKEVDIECDMDNTRPVFVSSRNNDLSSLVGLYKDAHCFIISSGPSIKDFPYKDKLKNVFTVCLNNSIKGIYPDLIHPNLHVIVDHPSKFLIHQFLTPQTVNFIPDGHRNKGLYHSDLEKAYDSTTKDIPNAVFYKRNNMFNPDRFLLENSINWGNGQSFKFKGVNGKRSVLIATLKILYLLGFRHVYLLGVDFSMNQDKPYSFEQSRHQGSSNGNNASYEQMKRYFEALQPKFLKAGCNIYNLNPHSQLKVFPYMDFMEAQKKALHYTPSVDKFLKGKMCNTKELYNTQLFVCPNCNHEKLYDTGLVKQGNAVCKCKTKIEAKHKKKRF